MGPLFHFCGWKKLRYRLSSLTRVMWLVAVGSGLNSLGSRVRVLKGLVCTICCPILSYSNLCCVLFWNFLSLRFVLCKGVIMFSIIKIPGKILVLVRTWNSMEWWVWRVGASGKVLKILSVELLPSKEEKIPGGEGGSGLEFW